MLPQYLGRPIAAAIVDDDELPGNRTTFNLDVGQEAGEGIRTIPGSQNDADVDVFRLGHVEFSFGKSNASATTPVAE